MSVRVSHAQTIVNIVVRTHAIDEEVMLVHVYLDARSPAIEVEKGLSTMLREVLVESTSRSVDGTYVHHLGVTSPIRAVEQVQHILLELLAVSVDVFPCLDDRLHKLLDGKV